jgi:predicted dehydrogenase
MINVGVIGCGYWGPNLIRNFNSFTDVNMVMAADLNPEKLAHLKKSYPHLVTSTDYHDIVNSPEIDAVAVVTPVLTHYKIARDALINKKHVFVEKPLASGSQEVEELIALARQNELVLMVGHIFQYNAAIRKIKEIIDSGELGNIYYISCQRLNLGLFQQDINVIWDLAPHEISILLYLLGKDPTRVSASGASHINPQIEDVGFITMEFPDNLVTYIQTSWLDPNKIRKMTIVGSKKMLVFDDVEPIEKIKIYYKGVDAPEHYDTFGEFQYTYRYGDIIIPMVKNTEPLKTELEHFRDSIIKKSQPLTDGESGLRVVKILEACQESLRNDGKKVDIV